LDLPGELRNQIVEHLLADIPANTEGVSMDDEIDVTKIQLPSNALSLTCKQLHKGYSTILNTALRAFWTRPGLISHHFELELASAGKPTQVCARLWGAEYSNKEDPPWWKIYVRTIERHSTRWYTMEVDLRMRRIRQAQVYGHQPCRFSMHPTLFFTLLESIREAFRDAGFGDLMCKAGEKTGQSRISSTYGADAWERKLEKKRKRV
jgi:hypothetical protein